jgi:large subunit ribosomal protein L24
MIARIKKNDKVKVITGKDQGKEGAVIAILPEKGKVMVKGVNVVTLHRKARKKGEVSGIKKEESFFDIAKVMPVCTSCKKPCRIGVKELEQGTKARMCKRCEEVF